MINYTKLINHSMMKIVNQKNQIQKKKKIHKNIKMKIKM